MSAVAVDLERAVLLDPRMPSSLTLPATMPENARRRSAASRWRAAAVQVQRRHRLVGGHERLLEVAAGCPATS